MEAEVSGPRGKLRKLVKVLGLGSFCGCLFVTVPRPFLFSACQNYRSADVEHTWNSTTGCNNLGPEAVQLVWGRKNYTGVEARYAVWLTG